MQNMNWIEIGQKQLRTERNMQILTQMISNVNATGE